MAHIIYWFFYLFFFSQGDYDVVINDYEKAKSLFGNTEVAVFKKGSFFFFYFCPLWGFLPQQINGTK